MTSIDNIARILFGALPMIFVLCLHWRKSRNACRVSTLHSRANSITYLSSNRARSIRAVRRHRRRRRPHVGVAPAPFSWRDVMLYTSCMLLDCCNAVCNEAWTLTKSSKNDADVFRNSPWYSKETRRRKRKSIFVDNFVKMKADGKSFVWNFFGN